MSFKSRKISSGLSVGQRLKRARLRKKYSLEFVESKTKIRAKYISAIESDSFDKLPNTVYVKGFLKTYATFLNINQNDILDHFYRENLLEEENLSEISRNRFKKPKIIISSKTLIISGATLLILGFILFLIFQITGFISPPSLEVYKPLKDGQVSGREVIFQGKTDPAAEIFINDQAVAINSQGDFTEELFLKEGTNIVSVKAVNKAGKEVTKVYTFYANLPKTVAGNSIEKSQLKEINLKVQVLGDSSWLKVITDGKIAYQGIMIENAEQSFKAKKEILFSTGNAGVTRVILNGKDQGFLGEKNEVKKNISFK